MPAVSYGWWELRVTECEWRPPGGPDEDYAYAKNNAEDHAYAKNNYDRPQVEKTEDRITINHALGSLPRTYFRAMEKCPRGGPLRT
jgi:hypothetical protein